MHLTVIPLTELLMALDLHESKALTRALRLGAAVTCLRQHRPDGPRYVLQGRVGIAMVTTGEHRALGPALLGDLAARLEPHLHRRAAERGRAAV
ncbi:hypothetical protein [Deinococcus yunweiensis]|uniref:hypothetical protein n=1 Tax=Deinococcus yunweiensis TaxID=367282 RepID=UPI00398E97AF